jgi:hypothetical protein
MSLVIDDETKALAFAAIDFHPLKAEANSWEYCVSDIFKWPKKMLGKAKISHEEKQELDASLADTEEVLIVIYHASEKRPEPLHGHGKSYSFVIHPLSYKLLLSEIGTWRS